jgi:hypothetical protein
MQGVWRRASAPEHSYPIQFDCVATADEFQQYTKDGRMQLRGTLRAENIASEVPCEGELLILLPRQKQLKYAIQFRGDDQQTYTLSGEKRVRYLDLLYTMTHLNIEILDAEGRPVGFGEMTFDLRDLPAMVKSFFGSLV